MQPSKLVRSEKSCISEEIKSEICPSFDQLWYAMIEFIKNPPPNISPWALTGTLQKATLHRKEQDIVGSWASEVLAFEVILKKKNEKDPGRLKYFQIDTDASDNQVEKTGELTFDGREWYVATLTCSSGATDISDVFHGYVRLKHLNGKVVSQHKRAKEDNWSDQIISEEQDFCVDYLMWEDPQPFVVTATLRKHEGTLEVSLYKDGVNEDTHYITIHKKPLQVELYAIGQSEGVTQSGFANIRRAGPYVQWMCEDMMSIIVTRLTDPSGILK
jgi:hypothetical protein